MGGSPANASTAVVDAHLPEWVVGVEVRRKARFTFCLKDGLTILLQEWTRGVRKREMSRVTKKLGCPNLERQRS